MRLLLATTYIAKPHNQLPTLKLLANRFIRRDEQLVRSANRLR